MVLNPAPPRRTELGMLLMALAMLLFPVSDALAKSLAAAGLSPGQVAASRFLIQSLLLLPVLVLRRRALPTPPGWRHLALGALIALAAMLLFWGLKYLPLANNTALFFVEPILLTLISALLLREDIDGHQWAAVAIGLGGALIVLRPNWAAYGPAAVLPVAAGACLAAYMALTRVVAAREDALTLAFWTGVMAALVLGGALLLGSAADLSVLELRRPRPDLWLPLAGVGAVAAVTNVLTAAALRRAAAGVLAPFQYLEIVGATALGWLMFGEIPDLLTGAGALTIIGSGLYVFSHNRGRGAEDRIPS